MHLHMHASSLTATPSIPPHDRDALRAGRWQCSSHEAVVSLFSASDTSSLPTLCCSPSLILSALVTLRKRGKKLSPRDVYSLDRLLAPGRAFCFLFSLCALHTTHHRRSIHNFPPPPHPLPLSPAMPSYGSMGGQSDWLLGENPPSGRCRDASYSGNPFASAAVEARSRHSWLPTVRVLALLVLVVFSLASFVLGPGLTPSSGLLEDAARQNRELRVWKIVSTHARFLPFSWSVPFGICFALHRPK